MRRLDKRLMEMCWERRRGLFLSSVRAIANEVVYFGVTGKISAFKGVPEVVGNESSKVRTQ